MMEMLRGKKSPRPDNAYVMDSLWSFISEFWVADPMARPEAGQLLERMQGFWNGQR